VGPFEKDLDSLRHGHKALRAIAGTAFGPSIMRPAAGDRVEFIVEKNSRGRKLVRQNVRTLDACLPTGRR